jgi:CheY-like chemotaxis protein
MADERYPPNGPVLIVEDDPAARELIVQRLQSAGFETVTAENGGVALEYLASDAARPCLILLDLNMPVMDGEAFRHEQSRNPSLAVIPVIVLTGAETPQWRASDLNAVACLVKPDHLRILHTFVRQHCLRTGGLIPQRRKS